jgi:hypothetical protein
VALNDPTICLFGKNFSFWIFSGPFPLSPATIKEYWKAETQNGKGFQRSPGIACFFGILLANG